MIKNYLKSAIHSLWRRKWFSLLTLVSIAISLVGVILISTYWNMLTAPIKPETNKSRIFYLQKEFVNKDNGAKLHFYDTNGAITKAFYQNLKSSLVGVEISSMVSGNVSLTDLLINGSGKSFTFRNTDGDFFKIFDFDFIDGKPYTNEMTTSGEELIVISDKVARSFFGTPYCAGKELTSGYSNAKIIGVFKTPSYEFPCSAEVYFAKSKKDLFHWIKYTDYDFVCLTKEQVSGAELNSQVRAFAQKYQLKNDKIGLNLYLFSSVQKTLDGLRNLSSSKSMLVLVLVGLLTVLSLFELLKSSLISRMEEMGVRRSFGATENVIKTQLVFENMLLTLLGGTIGLLIALWVFKLIGGNAITNIVADFFNWRALLLFLAVFVIAGFISGMIPALQMGKLRIVSALHNNFERKVFQNAVISKSRKFVLPGLLILLSFFVVSIAFDNTYYSLLYARKTGIPVDVKNRI